MSGEALQIAVKRREAKSKEEKERYKHLNAEFQRIARRDKRAFFSDECKEIEENNRMGKTRDLFKKIRDSDRPRTGRKAAAVPLWAPPGRASPLFSASGASEQPLEKRTPEEGQGIAQEQ